MDERNITEKIYGRKQEASFYATLKVKCETPEAL